MPIYDTRMVEGKRKHRLTFLTTSMVEHSMYVYGDMYKVIPVQYPEIVGYSYIVLLGKVGVYYREKYECLDYSVIRLVNTKTRGYEAPDK